MLKHRHFTAYAQACLLMVCIAAIAQAQNIYSQPAFIGQPNQAQNNSPITIDRPGNYALARDVVVQSGDAITITASGVTLDLNGRTVSTGTAGAGRGIFINGANGVEVRTGRVGSFRTNVMVMNSTNVMVEDLRIVGANLPPLSDGPQEIGVQITNARGVVVKNNSITAVNLGVFVRGSIAYGNRIADNTIVGGAIPANNLLGICYNPAPNANAETDGPRGDLIYNNLITRFGYAIAISAGSVSNIFRDNNLASFIGGFREAAALTTGGGTNVSEDNVEVRIPMN